MIIYKNSKIETIKAREILDSRGNPTLEVDLITDLGLFQASVPSGVSKGKYEALGLEAKIATKNINKIIEPKLKGKDPTQQKEIDNLMIRLDGTENKSRLGANAILGVSLALLRAGAKAKNFPLWKWISKIAGRKPILPFPCILCIEGGLHGRGDLNTRATTKGEKEALASLTFQEFMIISRANSFKERFRMGKEIYHILGKILNKRYGKTATNLGVEGAFIPPIKKTKEALDFIMTAIERAGYKKKVKIILDVAATSFFKKGKYHFENKILSKEKLLSFYSELCQKYPIIAIEDSFAEEDWQGFQEITKKLGKKITIIGDDLLVTNIKRIKTAVNRKACNGLILKPNQIGTVSETIKAANFALKNGWQVFVKHRGGETYDDFIADLAVGLGTGWIMAGAPSKGERMAKYDRLLRIEEELKK